MDTLDFFSISTSVVLGEVYVYSDFICRHQFFQATQSAILMSYVECMRSESRLQFCLKFEIEVPNRDLSGLFYGDLYLSGFLCTLSSFSLVTHWEYVTSLQSAS